MIDMPVVGILTMPDESQHFRGNRANFIDIIREGKRRGIPVYVVTARDLNPRLSRVVAYEYHFDKGQWKKTFAPVPDVVYNRIPEREDERRPEVKRLIEECLRSRRIRLYNPFFFNKWQLFVWLSASDKTRGYIPTTVKYSPTVKLLDLLKSHSLLYFKPARGKAGKGIMRVERVTRNGKKPKYVLSVQEERSSQEFQFPSLPLLRRYLDSVIGREDYIVQQGVKLSSFKGRPFDMRVLVQKNRRGVWQVSGIGARMAGETSITTHVPRGGSIDNPAKLLRGIYGRARTVRILRSAKRMALTIAKQIEKSCGHNLGEMSMDLGVDRRGKLWFFEANSKPMKFDEPHIRKRSLKRMFDYVQYLSSGKQQLRSIPEMIHDL